MNWAMTDQKPTSPDGEPITPEELEAHEGEPLPDREAMSVATPMVEGAFVDLELGGDPPAELHSADQ